VLSIPFIYFLVLANINSGPEPGAPGRGGGGGPGEGRSVLGAGLRAARAAPRSAALESGRFIAIWLRCM